MVADRTGRFAERPFYDAAELDRDCECLVSAFLNSRPGRSLPLQTDELTILIEQAGASLDSCVDLSEYGPDVHGMTVFRKDEGPEVSISDRLSTPHRENRLRSTLAHELGHVRYHGPLWESKHTARLFDAGTADRIICNGDTILGPDATDWMEWQAGYVSGAILMPAGAIRRVVSDICAARGWHAAVSLTSPNAAVIITAVAAEFLVSEEAARVRLLKLGLLSALADQLPLFG
jgi:Zn-dependent peptidase ImmA (M78 family)